ncbi:hypothetical protein L249_8608 [Ophiocordyceps polyrhachis-furcata BCC 54312]|uniref:Uncharacterized protein n=1 Tax=Ophiocordyceps polyrhachis-furcata BCC 54312 TaxID=1330021 RepID=A0A367L6S6_9HYPO|nr:hypothetical protein L249_8608 [Ophiocordyceps polyrhachis-furcata BCC 54312]
MQGFNMGRYMPPDQEASSSSSHCKKKKKTSGKDGSSCPPPPPTVRFEMPFAVWCGSCPKPTLIGQGVRFNAEKTRVGSYLTTPLWSFRFRHADCGGSLEIRTDPRNTAYVVASGGTKRSVHDAPSEHDLLRDEKRSNAFSALERTIEHRHQLRRADERIHGLLHSSARYWNDPYAQNQRLRDAFRPGRLRRQQDAASADRIRNAMSLELDILPAHQDDARLASLVSFNRDDDDADALEKPLFTPAVAPKRPVNHSASASSSSSSSSSSTTTTTKNNKNNDDKNNTHPITSSSSAAATRASLVSELAAKTRLAQDPFLQARTQPRLPSLVSELAAKTRLAQDPFLQARTQPRLRGVKRKRLDSRPPTAKQAFILSALVQYDSD